MEKTAVSRKLPVKIPPLSPMKLSLILILIVLGGYLWGIDFFELMEYKTIDLRFKSRGQIAPRSDIVLAVIDERSLAKEGKWVWPRAKLARLVDILSEAGARVIAFDIGFLEADETDKSLAKALSMLQKRLEAEGRAMPGLETQLKEIQALSANDQLLADAIARAKAKVVLGYFFQITDKEAGHISAEKLESHRENVSNSRYDLVQYLSAEAQNAPLQTASAPQSNIPLIAKTADYSGYFNMFPDPDGAIRRIPAVLRFGDSLYAPLALKTVSAWLDTPLTARIAAYGVAGLEAGKHQIPVDEAGQLMINYLGEEGRFHQVSITDILSGKAGRRQFKEKIVMIGATAVAIYDMRVTPFSNAFPGLEIHATLVDNILNNRYLHQPDWLALFDIFAIVVSGLALGFILPRLGAFGGATATLGLFAAYILLCQQLFVRQGLVLNMVYPLALMLAVYVAVTAHQYISESRQKHFIREAFSTFVAPSVVKELIRSPEKLNLGGEERVITAFFSDVQGFTAISERLKPGELVELLNEFLTEMTDIILDYQGTVDKFEGDAIIAFFGAPNEMYSQAHIACQASLRMQARLAELREKWQWHNKPALRMRIGMATGPAVVGNMGSKNRMDYTMMGDTVNTAARLEGVNKLYGTYILVSDTTYQDVGEEIVCREVDRLHVVGKQRPVSVYQPLGFATDLDETVMEMKAEYEKGLALYRKQRWEEAIACFERALEQFSEDGPSQTLIQRCRDYLKTPPPENWGGIFSMRYK